MTHEATFVNRSETSNMDVENIQKLERILVGRLKEEVCEHQQHLIVY